MLAFDLVFGKVPEPCQSFPILAFEVILRQIVQQLAHMTYIWLLMAAIALVVEL